MSTRPNVKRRPKTNLATGLEHTLTGPTANGSLKRRVADIMRKPETP